MKRWLSMLLALCMVWTMIAPALAVEADSSGIRIDKTYLRAGDALVVENPGNYSLHYYIDDEEVDSEKIVDNTLTLSPDFYEKWIRVAAYSGDELLSEDSVYFSKLPVLYIDTKDGEAITSKTEYKSATIFIQNNSECDDAIYSGEMTIKGRGNSSWGWPKKPYRIKLDKKTDLFDMGKNKNWVLLANYLDESLLRNTTAFQLSEELGLETMSSVWVDVVFNGAYAGNYQLCEQIRVDKTRINIFDWEGEAEELASKVYKKNTETITDEGVLEDYLKENLDWITSGEFTFEGVTYSVADYYSKVQKDISGGYLFELSNEYDEISKFKTNSGLKIMIKSPEYLNTNSEMMDYVAQFWENFEGAYKSEDGYIEINGEKVHYTQLADLDSMISYWLVMEVLGNNDSSYKSRYAHMDIDNLLFFGPVWDFDWGCGSSVVGPGATGWKVSHNHNSGQAFYKEFLDDPFFVSKAAERYWEIRPYLESIAKDGGLLDEEITYLYESGLADEAVWDRKITWPEKARGFETDTRMFKAYMQKRLAWLDQQFATDAGLLSALYVNYDSYSSAYPYTKSDDMLEIRLIGCEEDTFTEHAPATGVIGQGSNLDVSVTVNDADTASLNVYVNGLYSENVPVTDGEAVFTVTKESLTSEVDKKNVISLIGKNAGGETTYKNFVTVTVSTSITPLRWIRALRTTPTSAPRSSISATT